MTRALSGYLDGLRFLAAFLVLLSHFAYERFSGGAYLAIRDLNLGSDAVVLFFVLSGFVIAYTADVKDASLGSFAFKRATRLYSVAFPALILTMLCDRLGASLDPLAYDGWWYNPLPADWTMALGLSFASEWTGFGVRLGTNGPYWSLSYEVAYYILFGVAVYLHGLKKWLLLVLLTPLFGVNVLILLPAWLFGVFAYHAQKTAARLSVTTVRLIICAPPLVYALLLGADAPGVLKLVTLAVLGEGAVSALRFSDEFVWNALIGGLFALHLYAVAVLSARRAAGSREQSGSRLMSKVVTWFAGGTFSLYLVHYPLLQAVDTVLPAGLSGPVRDLALLSTVFAGCYVFAELFERPLPFYRRLFTRLPGRPDVPGLYRSRLAR